MQVIGVGAVVVAAVPGIEASSPLTGSGTLETEAAEMGEMGWNGVKWTE